VIHRAIDDESLGIRLHDVNRQRAVERAIERLRHGLRADWHYLTADDHANLRWVLGELWSTTSREHWDDLHFSKLDLARTRQLVSAGDRMRRHHTSKMSTLECVAEIVHDAGSIGIVPEAAETRSASLAY
jgi:hypothetical protein